MASALGFPDDPVRARFTQRTAVQTTKHTKHTKSERPAKKAPRNRSVGTSVESKVRDFVYFVHFVVPTVPYGNAKRPVKATLIPPQCEAGALPAAAANLKSPVPKVIPVFGGRNRSDLPA